VAVHVIRRWEFVAECAGYGSSVYRELAISSNATSSASQTVAAPIVQGHQYFGFGAFDDRCVSWLPFPANDERGDSKAMGRSKGPVHFHSRAIRLHSFVGSMYMTLPTAMKPKPAHQNRSLSQRLSCSNFSPLIIF
jgi:hypothetical protein